MEVWSQAHAKSDASEHHDAMRMFYAVEANLIEEAEAAPASNNKIKLITAKLLKQVTAELKAYTELMVSSSPPYFLNPRSRCILTPYCPLRRGTTMWPWESPLQPLPPR